MSQLRRASCEFEIYLFSAFTTNNGSECSTHAKTEFLLKNRVLPCYVYETSSWPTTEAIYIRSYPQVTYRKSTPPPCTHFTLVLIDHRKMYKPTYEVFVSKICTTYFLGRGCLGFSLQTMAGFPSTFQKRQAECWVDQPHSIRRCRYEAPEYVSHCFCKHSRILAWH